MIKTRAGCPWSKKVVAPVNSLAYLLIEWTFSFGDGSQAPQADAHDEDRPPFGRLSEVSRDHARRLT
ncbi:MAG TPA: hypothetical protein VE961_20665 [Pyrinomonadaceae bacterium]|nr:hypothetical protein [Pyrinomonadaceae bacterium]